MRKIVVLVSVFAACFSPNLVYAERLIEQGEKSELQEEVVESDESPEVKELEVNEKSKEIEEIEEAEQSEEEVESKEEVSEDREELEQQPSEEEDQEELSIQSSSVQTENTQPETADEWYEYARSQSASSQRLALFIEAYYLFPGDSRFVDGINESARSLLRWATDQHQARDFATAIDRYERILAAPEVRDEIRQEVEWKLFLANRKERIPANANGWLELARSQSASSHRLSIYIEGSKLYPNDQRFVDGINESAASLLRWATQQHQAGNFETAVIRYERILAAPRVVDSTVLESEWKLSLARSRAQIPSNADSWYNLASSQGASSNRLAMYIEAHKLYPNDRRFVEGINESATSLLRWATQQHRAGDYATAMNRYERIISASSASDSIILEAEWKLSLARSGRQIPNTANSWYNAASSQGASSNRLAMYIEGHKRYPNDRRFRDGIVESANALLRWATQQHQNGNYTVADIRYERIINAPVVSNSVKVEAHWKQVIANQNTRIPSSANSWNQLASSQYSSSNRLLLYIGAYYSYPNDRRFEKGVNDSANSLLRWAKQQHEAGNYDVATDRYELIISLPIIRQSIKNEASSLLALSKEGMPINRTTVEYTSYDVTLTRALEIQMGLSVPPQTDKYRNDPVFIHSSLLNIVDRGVIPSGVNVRTSPNTSSSSNIEFTTTSQTVVVVEREVTGSSVSGSTKWYEIRHNNKTLYVHSSLLTISQVAIVTENAQMRQTASTSAHSFGIVARNTELPVIRRVTGTSVSGSNQWYELSSNRTWRNATSSDVLPYLDPNQNDRFQHLVLSSSAGVSAAQLNGILSGKGILNGKGQAFIDAGKEYSVNEVYLIAHALLETGHGTSKLATGIEVGKNSSGNLALVTPENRSSLTSIRTVYNMYGINAVDNDAERQGAFHAYNQGWFTPEAAIVGGAEFIGRRYIHNSYKQNTLYKMRWNPANPGYPQYATDMQWAVKQINIIKTLYDQLDNPALHFDIPQYRK